jgi:hypothetical protein
MFKRPWYATVLIGGLLMLVGCSSTRTEFTPRDRAEYSDALAESWMREYLLNIVKLRYDAPAHFVDVSSVVSSYTLETRIAAEWRPFGILGHRRTSDSPAVTYSPVMGEAFATRYMTPIAPPALFSLVEMGLPAEIVLLAGVAAWNSLHNQGFLFADDPRQADEDFLRSLELFGRIQQASAAELRTIALENSDEVDPDDRQHPKLAIIVSPEADEQTRAYVQELKELLGLDPDREEFRLVFGSVARNGDEIAVRTRSVLQIMAAVAIGVTVPDEHVREGRVMPEPPDATRVIEVRSHRHLPRYALVAVRYRDHWFWIDDRDSGSKQAFSTLLQVFSFADTAEPAPMPPVLIQPR